MTLRNHGIDLPKSLSLTFWNSFESDVTGNPTWVVVNQIVWSSRVYHSHLDYDTETQRVRLTSPLSSVRTRVSNICIYLCVCVFVCVCLCQCVCIHIYVCITCGCLMSKQHLLDFFSPNQWSSVVLLHLWWSLTWLLLFWTGCKNTSSTVHWVYLGNRLIMIIPVCFFVIHHGTTLNVFVKVTYQVFFGYWLTWLLSFWTWVSSDLIIRQTYFETWSWLSNPLIINLFDSEKEWHD